MKLHRIHVENFKAIENRTLELPDTGIVVANGPNEVGKTSKRWTSSSAPSTRLPPGHRRFDGPSATAPHFRWSSRPR